jgi:hypothetical protein
VATELAESERESDRLKGVIAYGFDALGTMDSLDPGRLSKEGPPPSESGRALFFLAF